MQDQGLEPRGSVIFNIWREEDPTKHTENQQLVTQGENQESMMSNNTREERVPKRSDRLCGMLPYPGTNSEKREIAMRLDKMNSW